MLLPPHRLGSSERRGLTRGSRRRAKSCPLRYVKAATRCFLGEHAVRMPCTSGAFVGWRRVDRMQVNARLTVGFAEYSNQGKLAEIPYPIASKTIQT
jgi:hypothetical protein